jgi:hypothetical protein
MTMKIPMTKPGHMALRHTPSATAGKILRNASHNEKSVAMPRAPGAVRPITSGPSATSRDKC